MLSAVDSPTATGFPSPAEDYAARPIDLNEQLIDHPAASFFVQVEGNDLVAESILDGDRLLVDRSRPPVRHDLVVARWEDGFIVRRWQPAVHGGVLRSADRDHADIYVGNGDDSFIWGVVTAVIRRL